jgi:ADP-ribosylglycohydrolase
MTASSASPAAAFLGFAAGDALGATVEFMTGTEIAARHGVHREMTRGGWSRLPAGAVTDDTEMSLTLAVDADVLANLGVAPPRARHAGHGCQSAGRY